MRQKARLEQDGNDVLISFCGKVKRMTNTTIEKVEEYLSNSYILHERKE